MILMLLTIHFIADFLLQSNWMALNKSKNWRALTTHVSVYTLCFVPFGWKFAVITFVTHWITDYCTSRLTSKLWFIDFLEREQDRFLPMHYTHFAAIDMHKRHWFFVAIGFDQLIHAWTLSWTWWLL